MRRFFIDRKKIKGDRVVIDGEEAHHIRDVIRLKAGDTFLGLDGAGKTYRLRIKKITKAVEAEIEEILSKELNMPRVLLACALPKGRKFEDIIEKAAELGVSEIIPMVTQRTIVKVGDIDKAIKQKRWEKIAIEAAKQCGRDVLPRVYEAVKFEEAVKLTESLGYKKKIIPCLGDDTKYISDALSGETKEAAVFIGPEGDFSWKEIDHAKACGLVPVSLGPLVLKVDTACIFALSVIQAYLYHNVIV